MTETRIVNNPEAAAHPVQFRGSRAARLVLRWLGWRFEFEGLPALQGVLVMYPHTSNWDFPIAMLLKWAIGMPVKFWGKESLFRIPLFGAWLRWLGGVPLCRHATQGVVEQMTALMRAQKEAAAYFWLALSPEGTRSLRPGWRSGFYRLALQADVPLALACLDYSNKRMICRDFVRLTGDAPADMQRIARIFETAVGLRPALASPIRLSLDGDKP